MRRLGPEQLPLLPMASTQHKHEATKHIFRTSRLRERSVYHHFIPIMFSSKANRATGPQARRGQEAETSLQRQAAGPAGGRVQGGQIPVRLQEAGAVQDSPADRGPDQDLVPEQKDEMEETNDGQVGRIIIFQTDNILIYMKIFHIPD